MVASQKQTKINLAFIVLLLGVFMAALDNGIISAALTTINASFEVSPVLGSWGITIYTLGLAVTTPIVGKLADRYGRKKLFLIEITIFTIGSLGVALSPNFTFFLAARLLQSFGGGGLFIIASAHVISTFSKVRQGSMLGLLGGMNGIASVIGPNIGSFLIDVTGSWHWLFLINVPIGAALVVFGMKTLKETKEAVMSKIDYLGITLLSLSILSVMFAINLGAAQGKGSSLEWLMLALLVLGTIIFAGFLFVEKRQETHSVDAILPYSLLTKPTYAMTMVMALLSGTFIGAIIFIPSFAQQVLGISAAKSGYWMTPLALASGVGAGGGGYFVDKMGPVKTLVLAGVIYIFGFGGLAFFTAGKLAFILFSVIAGAGFGFVLGAPLTMLTSNAAGSQKGSALGTLSVARQIGLTLSPALFGAFIQHGFNKMDSLIPEKLRDHGLNPDDVSSETTNQIDPTDGYGKLQNTIDNISDPAIQAAVQDAFDTAAQSAYTPIYLFTVVMAIAIMAIVLIFQKQFHRDAKKSEKE
ncbi:putative transporter YebQ [Lentibacillus sp. JNUCC-1]|uniref:MFS transporter n=1 Tax=Lentibacillus sp. JNUCC-1 TaxID=2654513 RepID=UPI0012E98D7F|nr:MFS transporter [Lentibacillus sp. JNUCC-1]MUV36473.1 putative transporter YebQ [Lentibacillus sp. JNUCC-1]